MTDISTSEVELLRARLKTVILTLTAEEQKELLRMTKAGKAEQAEKRIAETGCSMRRFEKYE